MSIYIGNNNMSSGQTAYQAAVTGGYTGTESEFEQNLNKVGSTETVSLSGGATGSASFDGSANVSIPVTVTDDSHNHTVSHITDFASGCLSVLLTGLSTATNAAIVATDTILAALSKLQAQISAHKSDQTVHVTTLACSKSGTVYALTGLTATAGKVPVLFSVPAAYAVGDTVTINGAAYTLKTTDNTALTAGAWAAGAYIHATADIDNKNLWVWPSVPHNAADVGAINPNLLVNTDFTAPVNSLGQSSYSAAGPTIDKWTFNSVYAALTVNSGYIAVAKTSTAGTPYFLQAIDNYKSLLGKVVTYSVGLLDGTVSKASVPVPTSGVVDTSQIHIGSTNWQVGLNGNTSTGINLRFYNALGSVGDTMNLVWVKLEIGPTATTFSPSPREQELALCGYSAGPVALTSAGLRNIYECQNASDTLPTGLADGTIITRPES
jgi:hypothetical protein